MSKWQATKSETNITPHYLTCTIVGWADLFSRKCYKDIIIDSLAYCQKEKGLIVYAYVIMSNHIHLIAAAKEGSKGLSAIIGDFKKHTAKQIIKTIKSQPESRRDWLLNLFAYHAKYNRNNQNYQVWIQDNHPIELFSLKWIGQKINYVHLNPIRAGIVSEGHHYVYSSASNYRDGTGILAVTVIDLGITRYSDILSLPPKLNRRTMPILEDCIFQYRHRSSIYASCENNSHFLLIGKENEKATT